MFFVLLYNLTIQTRPGDALSCDKGGSNLRCEDIETEISSWEE